jgi:hypothetical protein
MITTKEQFAEFLVFLRTHPTQRAQLLKELSRVDLAVEHTERDVWVCFDEAMRISGLAKPHLAAMLRDGQLRTRTARHKVFVDRHQLEEAVRERRDRGMITYREALDLTGYSRVWLAGAVDGAYLTADNGWYIKQEVVDHVMRYGNRKRRDHVQAMLDAETAPVVVEQGQYMMAV